MDTSNKPRGDMCSVLVHIPKARHARASAASLCVLISAKARKVLVRCGTRFGSLSGAQGKHSTVHDFASRNFACRRQSLFNVAKRLAQYVIPSRYYLNVLTKNTVHVHRLHNAHLGVSTLPDCIIAFKISALGVLSSHRFCIEHGLCLSTDGGRYRGHLRMELVEFGNRALEHGGKWPDQEHSEAMHTQG